ncbi:MAG: HK97 family phage prohead protease [Nitrospinae bacterium]|nr:HK97 family phage prohead protease [Nitrospinota bacterium]
MRFEDDGVLRGVVMPYLERTKIGSFEERFKSGAFGDIGELRLNMAHDRKRPLCVNKKGGGLRLIDSETELRAEVDLPDTADGRDARELIKRGVLSGFSVEFRSVDETWNDNLRTINRAELGGLALVDRPQYISAVIEEIRQAQEANLKAVKELWPLV